MSGPPEFGPRGYVPPKASKRARKIVLREPMGLGWPIAAAIAGLVLVVLGAVYLLTRTGPPGPPFEALGPLDQVDPRGATVLPASTTKVLLVRAGGPVRAFVAPGAEVAYCRTSRRLEGADGSVWGMDGRLLGGPGRPLVPLPVQVFEGELYTNPSGPLPAPPMVNAGATPACAPEPPSPE